MIFYFKLQYKRLYRIIDSTGFNPIIGALITLFIFITSSATIYDKLDKTEIIYPILSLFFVGKLGSKKRNDFLRNTFNKSKYHKLRLVENLILALPFFLFMFFKHSYISGGVFLSITLAFSQFNKIESLSFVIPTPFYKNPFEFVVGFRNTFWLYPIMYFITFMSISVQNFNLGLFSLGVLLLTPLSFYTTPENPFFVWVHSSNPSEFLYRKIKIAILFSLALALPTIISLSIFFSADNYDVIATVVIIALFVLVTVILGKYSFYPSETPMQFFLLIFCVVFPPLILFILPYFYSKSNRNLKKLLK